MIVAAAEKDSGGCQSMGIQLGREYDAGGPASRLESGSQAAGMFSVPAKAARVPAAPVEYSPEGPA